MVSGKNRRINNQLDLTASQIFNEKKTLLQFGMLEFHSLVRRLHEYHNQKMTHDDCQGMHF